MLEFLNRLLDFQLLLLKFLLLPTFWFWISTQIGIQSKLAELDNSLLEYCSTSKNKRTFTIYNFQHQMSFMNHIHMNNNILLRSLFWKKLALVSIKVYQIISTSSDMLIQTRSLLHEKL